MKRVVFLISLIIVLGGFMVAQEVVTPVPSYVTNPSNFFKKCLLYQGIPILGSNNVDDMYFYMVRDVVDKMIGHRPDIIAGMIYWNQRIGIIAPYPIELTTDLPEHSYWPDLAYTRGLGGTKSVPLTSIGAENLHDPPWVPYFDEHIFEHEFGHTIHLVGMDYVDSSFNSRLYSAYSANSYKWSGTYAAQDHKEYWAEGVQAYFNCNAPENENHNHVNTREELLAFDPSLYNLCYEVFGPCTPEVEANFTFTQYASPSQLTVDFSDTSISAGTITSRSWDFGDGGSSSGSVSSHTYAGPGTYAVTLTVTDDLPSSDSITQNILCSNAPVNYCDVSHSLKRECIYNVSVGSIDNTTGWNGYNNYTGESTEMVVGEYYPLSVTCSSTWSSGSGCGVWIDWNQDGDFEDLDEEVYTQTYALDPFTTNISPPAHALSGATRMRIRLFWKQTPDPCGEQEGGEVEDYSVIVIGGANCAPTAGFTWESVNLDVNFTDTSYDSDGNVTSWSWTFGDGSSSSQQNPSHSYTAAGDKTVSLTITDDVGATDSYTETIHLTLEGSVKEDFVGSFSGMGVWSRNSDTGLWSKLTPEVASQVFMGDLDGDGKDDLVGVWDFGIFVRYSNGTWEKILNNESLIWLSTGDMNGDGLDDLVGSWTFGVWMRDSSDGSWTKIHNDSATQICVGDFDGDGYGDLLGVWDVGIWINYATGSWQKILGNENLTWLCVGDLSGDGRDDIAGSWAHGTWYRESVSGAWVRLHTVAEQIAAGDLDGDNTDDLVGMWTGIAGLWTRYSDGTWEKLNDAKPLSITTGKMR